MRSKQMQRIGAAGLVTALLLSGCGTGSTVSNASQRETETKTETKTEERTVSGEETGVSSAVAAENTADSEGTG